MNAMTPTNANQTGSDAIGSIASNSIARWNLQVPLPQELRVRVRSEMLRTSETLVEFVGAALERELQARRASVGEAA